MAQVFFVGVPKLFLKIETTFWGYKIQIEVYAALFIEFAMH